MAAPAGAGGSTGAAATTNAYPRARAGAQLLPTLIERIKNIVLTPKTEWLVIEAEPTSVSQLYTGYVMPMAAFAAVLSFIRLSIIGVSLPFGGTIRTPLASGLVSCVVTFILGLIGLFLVGFIINMLAPTFSGGRNQQQALKTAAYALTPAWLGTALTFLPLGTLLQLIACIYGIYVLYLGLPVMMRSQQDKAAGYTTAVVVCTILVGILFGVVGTMLAGVGRMAGIPSAAVYDAHNLYGSRNPQAAAAVGSSTSAAGSGEDAGSAADPAQNAMAATSGLLSALGGALGGNVHHEPIDFNTLKGMLPTSLPQMQRMDAQGGSQQALGALGLKSSSATADYSSSKAHLRIKISDMSGVSGLLEAASGLAPTGETQTDTGFEKDMVVNGRLIHEKYDRKSGGGEVSALIAKRFSVEVTGQGVDIAQLEKTLSTVDLARLEAMRDAGAQAH